MTKVTLDMDTFKALASDTRLDILRILDGKNLSLKDISSATQLNKATLHEHLAKLNEAGLVKRKEREGHKWVTYKLTWKGECLLHPENTRIVVMFAVTFIALWAGVVQLLLYAKSAIVSKSQNLYYNLQSNDLLKVPDSSSGGQISADTPPEALDAINEEGSRALTYGFNDGFVSSFHDPLFLYIAIACFVIFIVVACIAIWRLSSNKTPKL